MIDNEIHIKVELSRDDSGKLALTTIFDEKAPNFSKDEEGYYWIPTVGEKNFINEAFELLPATKTKGAQFKIASKPAAPKVEKPPVEPEIKNEMEPATISSVDVEIKKPEETPPPSEKKEDTAVFEVTTEKSEPNKPEELEPAKKLEDERVLVSANADAIDAALEKRREEKDTTIIEADEQTIIDKVLSQKKKGKWGRK